MNAFPTDHPTDYVRFADSVTPISCLGEPTITGINVCNPLSVEPVKWRRQTVLNQLSAEWIHCCENGVSSQTMDSFLAAMKLVYILPFQLPNPEVSVVPSGNVALEWYRTPDRNFVMTLGADQLISYSSFLGEDIKDGKHYLSGRVPDDMIDLIGKVYSD